MFFKYNKITSIELKQNKTKQFFCVIFYKIHDLRLQFKKLYLFIT